MPPILAQFWWELQFGGLIIYFYFSHPFRCGALADSVSLKESVHLVSDKLRIMSLTSLQRMNRN